MPNRSEKWLGGYIHTSNAGKRTYLIYRKIQGRLFEVSTRCGDQRAALKQLERFEADPANYQPVGNEPEPGLAMTAGLVLEFLVWSRDTKKNSKKHVTQQQRDLAWWTKRLGEKDLKRLDLGEDILAALKEAPGRRLKIAVLKSFYGWLRGEKHILKAAEDPTFGTLKSLKVRVAQKTKPKFNTLEAHEALIQALPASVAAHLEVLAGTGWHVTEVCRFAKEGTIQGNVLQVYQEKKDDWHRTQVSPRTLMAAEWLRGHGGLAPDYVSAKVTRAAKAMNLEFSAGWYRHTISKLAVDSGESREAVGDFLGHNAQTNKKHYSLFATPKKVPTLV